MRPSRVRQRWDEGKVAGCIGVHLTDPAVCELVTLLGFDCIWIDLEHHGTSLETASHMMRAARVGGADVMARPAKGELMRMGRMLEVGAHGILYPRCDDAAEAAEVVRWAKFAPAGLRGFDSGNADCPYGLDAADRYVAAANAQTWIAPQIETPEAAAQARAIAEVEGVDMLFFGPGDYSLITGKPGQLFNDPATLEAAEQVCRDALAAGKRFGTLTFNVEQTRRFIDLGAAFIACRFDITLLRGALTQLRDELTSAGIAFDPLC